MRRATITMTRGGLAWSVLLLILAAPGVFGAAKSVFPNGSVEQVELSQTGQHVTLSVNRTVAMKFTHPVDRVVIANDTIASVRVISPKLVLVTGKTFGFTQLVIWDSSDKQYVYDVRVDVDMQRLARVIHDASPRSRVQVSSILDTVVLSGIVPDAPTATRLLGLAKVFSSKVTNDLQIAGVQQVLLRSTVAEVSREATRALGFNATFFGADAFAGSNLSLINPTSIGLASNTPVPIPPPNNFVVPTGITVSPTTTLYFGLPRTQLETFIHAMQQDSLIRVLAEPNLVAISGQEAEFLAGGELPIPTPDQDGIAITFKQFGIRLKFKPVVQAGQIIRVTVDSEVSEPDFTNAVQISGMTIPGLSTRRTQTVVEIGSGQTFAIAGLLSESIRGVTERVPGLGSVPVLGALFRSANYERGETELMVMVTPELVSPMNPEQIAYVPGQDVTSPNDWQLYGLGLLEDDSGDVNGVAATQPAQAPVRPQGSLCGPWGIE